MPEPGQSESREDWLDRCMADSEAVSEFPDAEQRFAFCVSRWDSRGKSSVVESDKEVEAMSNVIEHKNAAFELKKEPDDDGFFEGYASVFNVVDQGMDIVERGAFENTLNNRKPKMLWQHDPNQPIGVWDELREDERGLFVKGRLLKDVARGREAMALMRAGALDAMSIGYITKEADREGNGGVRRLKELDLREISLVTFPMNESALITGVKSIRTKREYEKFLRDAGFSREEAKRYTAHGFTEETPDGQRDAVAEEAMKKGLEDLKHQLARLQENLNVRANRT